MSKVRFALVAACVAPTLAVCGCGTSGGSGACSGADMRQVQASIASVEAHAHVQSLRAIGPTCSGNDRKALIAQRTYPFVPGRPDAIKSAFSAIGWGSTSASSGNEYEAQLKSGRLITQVELLTAPTEEGGSTITASFTSTEAPA